MALRNVRLCDCHNLKSSSCKSGAISNDQRGNNCEVGRYGEKEREREKRDRVRDIENNCERKEVLIRSYSKCIIFFIFKIVPKLVQISKDAVTVSALSMLR